MRVAAEPACPAVRSIAQIFGRVDMAFEQPSYSTIRVAETI
jgi:hypothetical protein